MRKHIRILIGVVFMLIIMGGCGIAEVSVPDIEKPAVLVTELESNPDDSVEVPQTEITKDMIQDKNVSDIEQQKSEKEESQNIDSPVPVITETKEPEDDVEEIAENKTVNPVVEVEAKQSDTPEIIQTTPEEQATFFVVYSEAEMNEALTKGDLPTYFQMLNANSAATMIPDTSTQIDVSIAETEMQSYLSEEFVQYLNNKRESEGRSSLSWNSSMAATALERATEITADFSHNGVRNCTAENLAILSNSNVADWYDAFYASEVHRQNMLDGTYQSAAAAVCQVGNAYYAAVLFGF